MRFLILSDIHGDTDRIGQLDHEFARADAVLYAGDFACFTPGNPRPSAETGLPVLDLLMKKHESLFAVTGNCDDPSFREVLEERDVSVEGVLVYFNPFFICGAGGAMRFTGATVNERTEDGILSDLSPVVNGTSDDRDWNNLILLIHQPPMDTKLDTIASGVHVGSQKIRDFIGQVQPLLSVSGHIHESAGIDTIGSTVVVNPGSLAEGRYAVAEAVFRDGRWRIEGAELKVLPPETGS
ncbi:MAG: metallophosphoesterase family protein, partial [Spirochaetaceae bacterium]|nr:metallophosphoesterase family protein [Spirochaetaceae bacterium]